MPKNAMMPDQEPVIPPADPDMAEKLAVNRTGRLTAPQRRLVLVIGVVALAFLLCPVTLLIQMFAILLAGEVPVSALSRVIFVTLGALFMILFAGLVGVNVKTFMVEAFMRHPVKVTRGPLEIRVTEGHRPELPFSYIIADYSFAPYVAPPEITLRTGAPYIVYYSAHSRLLLSIAALDAPDAALWEPAFE
jgi:hypothetical protein